jgi:alkanesulfonate monooxygenase SsuD/methylene tetrahydromethanopterin reductase-like flavin-dependent oxidoreductase (luciferase family)
MWASDVFEYSGKFFRIPPTRILPKPVQQPHPPMYAACSKPETARLAGELGVGALNFAFGSDDYLGEKVREYRAAVAAAEPVGRAKTEWFACTPAALCLPDDRKACRYGTRGARFFIESLSRYYFGGARPTGELDVPRDFLSEADLDDAMAQRNSPGSQLATLFGDPAAVREGVQRFVDSGIDELMLVQQMGTVPHELVMESLRTFGEQVMPHFS